MQILKIRNDNNFNKLEKFGKILQDGGLVIFPTETVYGIGADAFNIQSVKNIYIAKGRESDNPLIAHICNLDMLNLLVQKISPLEKKLIEKFWPGPLTIVFPKKEKVPYVVTGNLETVAVRMPSNKIALKLIEYANTPIVAPSANLSGKPSGTNLKDIKNEFKDKVQGMIDGGNCEVGVESTVIRCDENSVTILRPGKITPNDLLEVADKVVLDKHIFENIKSDEKVQSPGMKYKHYAPMCKCVMVMGEQNNIIAYVNLLHEKYKKVIFMGSNQIIKHLNHIDCYSYGDEGDYKSIANFIFTLLRKADKHKPDILVIEGVKKENLGIAIMNRLIRACSYNIIDCDINNK